MLRRIGRSVKFCNRHKCNRLTLSRYFRIRRLLSALSVGVPVVIDQYCAFMKHVSYIQCNVSGSTSSDALYRLQYHSVCQLLQLISPIAWTLCKDAVCCYWSSVVCVCMSVSVGHNREPSKTDEPIEISCGGVHSWVGRPTTTWGVRIPQGNSVLCDAASRQNSSTTY